MQVGLNYRAKQRECTGAERYILAGECYIIGRDNRAVDDGEVTAQRNTEGRCLMTKDMEMMEHSFLQPLRDNHRLACNSNVDTLVEVRRPSLATTVHVFTMVET